MLCENHLKHFIVRIPTESHDNVLPTDYIRFDGTRNEKKNKRRYSVQTQDRNS